MTHPSPPIPFFRVFLGVALFLLLTMVMSGVPGGRGLFVSAQGLKGEPRAFLALPGFWSLNRPDVQKDIALTTEQLQKLQDVSAKYAESRKKNAFLDWARMSAAEQKKKMEELAAQEKKDTENIRKQVEAILTPEQVNKVEMVELRLLAPELLLFGRGAEQLGLNEDQKNQLNNEREEFQKKASALQLQMQKLQEQTGNATLKVLTPEQLKALKRLVREQMSGWGDMPVQPGTAPARPER